MDTDSFVFSFTRIKGWLKDLKHFSKKLDLEKMDPTHELYSTENMEDIGKMKLQ